MRKTRFAFNAALLTWHLITIYYLNEAIEVGRSKIRNQRLNYVLEHHKFAFFTNWSYAAQTFCFLMELVCQVLMAKGYVNMEQQAKLVKDYVFITIASPASIFVTITFWTIYAVNPTYIMNVEFFHTIPGWMNHSVHTINSLAAVADLLLFRRLVPDWKSAIKGFLWFNSIYLMCVNWSYFITGIWVYPLLEEMKWPIRIGLMGFLVFFYGCLAVATRHIHTAVIHRSVKRNY